MTNAIEIHNLTKNYGKIAALRGIDLTVPEGIIFGLLGANGAGKSTLIKALVGGLKPTSGTMSVLGLNPLQDKKALRAQIGYMPQDVALYADLSAHENLRFFGKAHNVNDLEQRINEALDFTELTSRANDPIYGFSGGMKKRVSLACALLHKPKLLFLDEPTAAVDPHLRARSWTSFRELAKQGVTLFVSTHLMDEALLCDRLGIQHNGKIIIENTPAKILEHGRTQLTIAQNGDTQTQEIPSTAHDLAQALRQYGLHSDVDAIDLHVDTLETIMLQLSKTEEIA